VTPSLTPGSLHVWRTDLDRGPEVDSAPLSADELERARRFRRDRDRVRWTRSRAILRQLLAGYLGVEPAALELSTGPNGKPRVAGERIEFNVSHSGRAAVLAFALDNPVGVDVELRGKVRDPLRIAGLVLGAAELRRLRSLPGKSREREFLRSWVRYEAALKCVGGRLGDPVSGNLHLIDLDLVMGGTAAVALPQAPAAVLHREVGFTLVSSRRDPDRVFCGV
jgi:4'-phosphopantetheinyl transferase